MCASFDFTRALRVLLMCLSGVQNRKFTMRILALMLLVTAMHGLFVLHELLLKQFVAFQVLFYDSSH